MSEQGKIDARRPRWFLWWAVSLVLWVILMRFTSEDLRRWMSPMGHVVTSEFGMLTLTPWVIVYLRFSGERRKRVRAVAPEVIDAPRWGRWMPRGVWPLLMLAVFYSPLLLALVMPERAGDLWYPVAKLIAVSLTVLLAVLGALLVDLRVGAPGRGITIPADVEQPIPLLPLGCYMWALPAIFLGISLVYGREIPWHREILLLAMGVAGVHFCLGVVEARRWGRVIREVTA